MNVRIPLKEGINGKFLHIADQSVIAICTMIGIYIYATLRCLAMSLFRHEVSLSWENWWNQGSLNGSFTFWHIIEASKCKLKGTFLRTYVQIFHFRSAHMRIS